MPNPGLYIHVPFCSGKCHYCDFYSVPAESGKVARYLSAVSREAGLLRGRLFGGQKPEVNTLYIGGGTPTELSNEELGALGKILHDHFLWNEDAEFTSEANPESVTGEKIDVLKSAGVNRISLGVQTFDDGLLRAIGRRHTGEEAHRAFRALREHGVANVGLDLIYALPDQSVGQFRRDLATAVDLGPEHVSCYELTYEPGTKFFDRAPKPGDSDRREAEMFYLAHATLTRAGYEHYEISNYARPGFACRHNLHYWRNGAYLGLGPSAAGFARRRRYKNLSDLDAYTQRILQTGRIPVETEETLSDRQFAGETAMLNLRTAQGIVRGEFQKQTGFDPFGLFQDVIEKYRPAGLVDTRDDRIFLTLRGMALSNEVLTEVL